jgi:hypothetical protein
MCYTFDVAKCDRIFDYLLQGKQIKLPSGHIIPSSKQLKKHAYCKWHNSYSHATNNCNVSYRLVQSSINKGRLKFAEKSPNEAQQGLVPDEHDQARWEDGPSSALSGQVNQGQGCRHRRRAATKDDQAKKSERWPMVEE